MKLAIALIAASAFGQGVTSNFIPMPVDAPGSTGARIVTVTVSKQPLAIFTINLGSKLTGLAGYSVRPCATRDGAIVSGGRIAQWIETRGLPIVPVGLAAAAASEARINSRLYRTMQYTSEAAYYLSLLMGANIIRVGTTANGVGTLAQRAARLGPIVVGHEAEKAKDALGARLPDPVARFKGQVLDDQDIVLQPGQCTTLVFMGQYLPTFTTLSGTVEGR